jgi:hypothetical protein
MGIAMACTFISIAALFISGHHLLALMLLLLNLLMYLYLLYGKMFSKKFFEGISIKKDIWSLLLSGLVVGILYWFIQKYGEKTLVANNEEIMLITTNVFLLSMAFLLVKIQQEEKR